MKSYLHPLPGLEYTLIEVLLSGEKERTPELHTAQQSPVLVDPAFAFPEKTGDLLRGHYGRIRGFVNAGARRLGHQGGAVIS
jgi:hypothetical protein